MFSNEEMKPTKRRSWLRTIGLLFTIAIFLAVGAGAGAMLYIANALQPVESQSEPVRVSIEPGMSSAQIGRVLEQHELIRNAEIFRYYLYFKGKGNRMQAGEYAILPGKTIDEIVEQLESGDVVPVEMVRITIPEGFTAVQIAERMGQMEDWDEQQVLKLLSNKDAYDMELLKHIPDLPTLKYPLEGYLFPETYDFVPGTSEEEAVRGLLQMTTNKLKQLPEDWEDRLQELNITFHEMMTIASLIEREVVIDHERPVVAGVIYNRLASQMRLQIDATVQYALGKQKEVVLYEDLKVDSPYNTYENDGLPPGPIASPSLESIKAALYPEETDYYYYVTKKDGSREHLFAKTYEEHLRNKAESEKQ